MGKTYDFKEIESDVLKFWEENQVYPKIKKRNHGKKKFYFLQGPPYTSGRLHLGQTWNHTLKDMILRFKRMNGFDAWDRGGYDMHGLPTENKVQAKFNLETKKDIINFGLEKFSTECLKFSEGNAHIMSEDLWKLGVWVNNDNAYMPIKNSFIEGEWFLIKKAHEKNRLYKGNKVMTWCKSCETALAKHELEYKSVEDNSIFVKFKIKNTEDEYLIIWTTTPWTIPFNLAVMVNPELEYIKADVTDPKTGMHEKWIVSLALSGAFINGVAQKEFKIIEQFKGDALLGINYEHPFHSILPHYSELKKSSKNVHTVILSEEFVDTSAGTGLVHCAPGCGPEDFEIGKRYNISALNNIDELGVFPSEMKRFAGMTAKSDDGLFIDILREVGALIETSFVEHEYAHCWRCKNPVIFRLTDQWFFKTEDLKDRMIEFNKDIKWYPEAAKNAFDSWLKNLKDNSITRQRFWGTPVPIWQCKSETCAKYEVIGSIAELKEKAITPIPNNLHIPWINTVKLKCTCGKEMEFEGDVLDVWIDAGTTSWNCLDYPNNTELFEKYYPSDFIIEGKDQIRGWFNLLMVASTLAFDKPAFKNVGMHGFITDVEGEKMSKSLGNIITPGEITEKYGADTLRYFVTEITAGEDMSFSWDEIKLKHKNLMIFWNLHTFIIDFQSNNDVKLVSDITKVKLDNEEKYMLSRLNSTIKDVTAELELYHFDNVTHKIEELYMDLSRIYIQLIREKSVIGNDADKQAILYTLYTTYINIIKMFSIISPFITERIYHNLKNVEEFKLDKLSVHEYEWPKYNDSLINETIEKDMKLVQDVMQSMLSCREKLNMGVRWPVAECIIDTQNKDLTNAILDLKDLIMQQINVKKIDLKTFEVELTVKPNFKNLGKDFGVNTARVVELINANSKNIASSIKDNKAFNIEGFEITTNHVIIEKICPEDYVFAEINGATIYLNKNITIELEEEGYAREITRRIQQLRKDSGLSKKDVIELGIKGDIDLSRFDSTIKEKVGAKTINYNPSKEYTSTTEEKIKGKKFHIGFDRA
ncbi:MAG: isoleucine--tRNA ligase [Candidatus Woesearchaeota archaeon]